MTLTIEPAAAKKARPHTRYYTRDGHLVPGTTTVVGVLDKGEGIKIWANKLGLAGIMLRDYVDALAEIGTLAHAMILETLGGEPWDRRAYSLDQIERAEACTRKFQAWAADKAIQTILIERPLVSERYRYGGTIDWYGRINGVPTLIDLKSSRAPYLEHFIQLAAYRELLLEHKYPVESARIVQVGRTDDEGFSDTELRHPDLHFALFEHCLAIYNIRAALKAGAGAVEAQR